MSSRYAAAAVIFIGLVLIWFVVSQNKVLAPNDMPNEEPAPVSQRAASKPPVNPVVDPRTTPIPDEKGIKEPPSSRNANKAILEPDSASDEYLAAVRSAPSMQPQEFETLRERIVRINFDEIDRLLVPLDGDSRDLEQQISFSIFPGSECTVRSANVSEGRPGYFIISARCEEKFGTRRIRMMYEPELKRFSARLTDNGQFFQLVPLEDSYALAYEVDPKSLREGFHF